jgi:hypothetical protein
MWDRVFDPVSRSEGPQCFVYKNKQRCFASPDRVIDPVPHRQKLLGNNRRKNFLFESVRCGLIQALGDN